MVECHSNSGAVQQDVIVADASNDLTNDVSTDAVEDAVDSGTVSDSSSSTDVGPLADYCVKNWPAAPVNATPKPSLDVTPSVLWKKTIPGLGTLQQIAFNGEKLALVQGNRLSLVDLQGNVTLSYTAADAQSLSAPVADAAGNFYTGGVSYRSFDSTGKPRWSTPLGAVAIPSYETTPVSNSHISPDNVVYFAAGDKYLYTTRG
jgi:hypothetical protein